MKTSCSKCGTEIKNVIFIDSKPYGTECAVTVLGINKLPSWFKGGNWNEAKLEQNKHESKQRVDFQTKRDITRKNWNDFIRLSKASLNARRKGNEWGANFIESIKSQAGFYTLTIEGCKFETMEQAELGWNDDWMGSFPYLTHEIKGISGLSKKQIEILEKIER